MEINMEQNYYINRKNLEIVKLSIGSLGYYDLLPDEELYKIILYLYNGYLKMEKEEYLDSSILHIAAFLEMGFDYRHIFDRILEKRNIDKMTLLNRIHLPNKRKANKSQIRGMIGKWKKGSNITIVEVIADIMQKVSEGREGVYLYENGKDTKEAKGDKYELIITPNKNFFIDLKRNKVYLLEK